MRQAFDNVNSTRDDFDLNVSAPLKELRIALIAERLRSLLPTKHRVSPTGTAFNMPSNFLETSTTSIGVHRSATTAPGWLQFWAQRID